MYSIERNIHDGILIVRLVNLNTNEFVSVLPENGARRHAISLSENSDFNTIIASADSSNGQCQVLMQQAQQQEILNTIDDNYYISYSRTDF